MKLRDIQEDYINLNPLQAGGRSVAETRSIMTSYSDGYASYDMYSGSFSQFFKKETALLYEQLNEFLGTDKFYFTHGVREAKTLLFRSILKAGDLILIDGNAHFSTGMAAERLGIDVFSTENSGTPNFEINAHHYETEIKKLAKRNIKPKLLVLTQVDGNYGNLVDIGEITLLAHKYNIPVLLNSAYLAGRTRVNLRESGADFIVISGHKSFGAPGHIGGLGVLDKWEKSIKDYSDESKPWDLPTRYPAIVGLYASLSTIDDRVDRWREELEKTNWFVEKMESLGGINLLGQRPKRHDLILFNTPILDKISAKKRKKGYFLATKLKERGIIGLRPGQTRQMRVSIYGLTWKQTKYVYEGFANLIKEGRNGI